MPFYATPIHLSKTVEEILMGFAKSRTLPLNQIQRSQIILAANEGKNNQEISIQMRITRDKVSTWRMRWVKNAEHVDETEKQKPDDLQKTVETVLKDLPRPGCPCDFTEVQILQIMEIACRNPAEFGYEASHWSLPQLAKAVTNLGIVDSISPASVGRFLKYRRYPTTQNKILVALDRQSGQT
jgi:transposase